MHKNLENEKQSTIRCFTPKCILSDNKSKLINSSIPNKLRMRQAKVSMD